MGRQPILKSGQYGGQDDKCEPTVNEFARAPEPTDFRGNGHGEGAVTFQPEDPAGMEADGEIEVARALIGQAEQQAGQREVEKSGYQLMGIGEAGQHLGEQEQAGIPVDLSLIHILNQVEIWFSILSRAALRGASLGRIGIAGWLLGTNSPAIRETKLCRLCRLNM